MNEITTLKNLILDKVQTNMREVAGRMADDMQNRLAAGNHIDTGNLISSITPGAERDDKEITAYIDITAESEKGAWYAEFLEFGTGIYNERGDGRQTPWKYQDREGKWHQTQGMQADPFIRPSVAAHIGELEGKIDEALNIERYKR